MLDERLGKWSFWTMLVGFNVTFFPMHLLGQRGMVRRIYTYDDGLGWTTLNLVVSIGSVAVAVGTLLTVVNVVRSRRHGAPAGANPWDADTLEWATESPPPEFNFLASPHVRSRHPLWDDEHLDADADDEPSAGSSGPAGAAVRSVAVTTGFDAEPDGAFTVPAPSATPAVVALGLLLFCVGLLIDAVLIFWIGAAIGVAAVVWWAWRTDIDHSVDERAAS
jgi:hypothetical protein